MFCLSQIKNYIITGLVNNFFYEPCNRVTSSLQKRNHHKCLLLSRTKRVLAVSDIIIRWNKIDFVESASNLSVIFNGRLTWSNYINVIVGKVYGVLRNLWAVIDLTPFTIRMRLAKTYLIPVVLYGFMFTGFHWTVVFTHKHSPNLTSRGLDFAARIS